jgi:hypothetical protein
VTATRAIRRNLTGVRRHQRQSISVAIEVDQPGDDEGLIDDIDRAIELGKALRETYATGRRVEVPRRLPSCCEWVGCPKCYGTGEADAP